MRTLSSFSLLVFLVFLIGASPTVWADEAPKPCPICRAANSQDTPYPERAGASLVRGATNTAFGWTELMMQPAAEVERGGNLAVGIGKGLGAAVQRTAAGLGEMFTFWVPKGAQGYPILTKDCPICSLPTAQHKPQSADVAKSDVAKTPPAHKNQP